MSDLRTYLLTRINDLNNNGADASQFEKYLNELDYIKSDFKDLTQVCLSKDLEIINLKSSNMHLVVENAQLKEERDSALKRCEELERKYNLALSEASKMGDKMSNIISNLEHTNKVLVEGVRVLIDNIEGIEKDNCPAYDGFPSFDFYRFGFENDGEHDINSIKDDNTPNDDYNKIKAMLEVAENEES